MSLREVIASHVFTHRYVFQDSSKHIQKISKREEWYLGFFLFLEHKFNLIKSLFWQDVDLSEIFSHNFTHSKLLQLIYIQMVYVMIASTWSFLRTQYWVTSASEKNMKPLVPSRSTLIQQWFMGNSLSEQARNKLRWFCTSCNCKTRHMKLMK